MSVKSNKIGVAIIGAGLIGKKRAEALLNLTGYKLEGVYDISQAASKDFAAQYKCRIFSDINEIINDSKVDLVILAIVHKVAKELAPKILKKKNLLLEKPIGRNLAETKKIVAAAKKSKNKLFGGFNYRFYPHVLLLKDYLEKKRLGKIVSSSFVIGHAAFPGYEKTWKMDKDLCGGGVILDPGIHLVDLMLFLLGAPKSREVFKNSLGWKTKVEDEAFLFFEFPNKSYSNHHYSLNFSKNIFEIEVVGTLGVVKTSGRGGNYGNMKFSFTPRWFWKTGKEIMEKDFGSNDASFEAELAFLSKNFAKKDFPDYIEYLNSMKLIDNLA